MSIALTLLDEVRWRGIPVAGDRPQALLAALAAHDGRPVRAAELIELVWGDNAPRNGLKSLQVLVSRARTACGADAIVTDAAGYRLGAAPGEVDSGRLAGLVRDAAAALDRDAARAAALAADALALAGSPSPLSDAGPGPLARLRRAASADAAAARLILARARSRTGDHAAALPELAAAHAARPQDEPLLADLLRSEAAASGPAVALERYERYRRGLRDRLGTDPGELLQRTQRSLLALDRPVRRGLRYDATELIGRDADLHRLRALMASSRVVSIIGAGGLGKTRLAHALARESTQPVVHFVELAGVTAAEDVAVEVGSVLGVRDSVSGRRALTAQQRADMRTRIAQLLGRAPGLLVLDNCEHLIAAVAELVAVLVAATPEVRVLTTSRAPLSIAAERVYPLGELGAGDAAALFCERAVAARPGVRLPGPAVASIVSRLDGLPLAIELAAAKVRVMAVEEIDRRLEDRFALLRGGDRSAPTRHQALLTVIEWSWNLLGPGEQRALRWLALFHDGFTLDAAGALTGADAVDAVRGLVDQSLLNVTDTPAGVRYRMLETVREFGQLQLGAAGEAGLAQAGLRRWAIEYAAAQQARMAGASQIAAVTALAAEETNLADELRAAISGGDRGSLVQLLAVLGLFWTMRGEHLRVLSMARAVTDSLSGWTPPPELADATRAAVGVTLGNSMMAGAEQHGALLRLLRGLGPGSGGNVLAGFVRVMLAYDPGDTEGYSGRLAELAADPDRHTAATASLWLSHFRENAGDPLGGAEAARRALALARDTDGPWPTAMPHTLLAQLTMHLGDHAAAAGHARAALPVMQQLGASDDEIQLRALLALCAIATGRLDDAARELAEAEAVETSPEPFSAATIRQICRAELLLVSGGHAAGLRLYRDCAARMSEAQFLGLDLDGTEPWTLFGYAMSLSAHAWYAAGPDEAHGRALFATCRAGGLRVLTSANPRLDYPAFGLLLFALGAWSLVRKAAPPDDGLRLVALADRFAYNRTLPTMRWDRIAAAADEALPGRLAEMLAQYAGRRPSDLLAEAWRAVERLPPEGNAAG